MKKMTSMKSILGSVKPKAAASKAAPKKKAPAKVNTVADPPISYRETKSVRITKAENGLTVSTYGPKGEELRVAKTDAEAMRHCKEMLK